MPDALAPTTSTIQGQIAGQIAGAAHSHLATHAVSKTRKRIALAIAGLADLIQLGFYPAFIGGALEIPDDVLDGIVAVLLLITLGWKWRVLAALLVELVPGVALFPTWTAVVLSVQSEPPPVESAPAAAELRGD